jgi:hypothetical protein
MYLNKYDIVHNLTGTSKEEVASAILPYKTLKISAALLIKMA